MFLKVRFKHLRVVLNFGPEKCLKECSISDTVSRVEFTSEMKLWSSLFLFEMHHICRYDQFESGSKLQFDT